MSSDRMSALMHAHGHMHTHADEHSVKHVISGEELKSNYLADG